MFWGEAVRKVKGRPQHLRDRSRWEAALATEVLVRVTLAEPFPMHLSGRQQGEARTLTLPD